MLIGLSIAKHLFLKSRELSLLRIFSIICEILIVKNLKT
ncbi:hypothetical protein A225_4623 [Klebsiella michiganensis E718]|nr:hypothetical protein A225_4623 [Klebsiella michiganensis E718]